MHPKDQDAVQFGMHLGQSYTADDPGSEVGFLVAGAGARYQREPVGGDRLGLLLRVWGQRERPLLHRHAADDGRPAEARRQRVCRERARSELRREAHHGRGAPLLRYRAALLPATAGQGRKAPRGQHRRKRWHVQLFQRQVCRGDCGSRSGGCAGRAVDLLRALQERLHASLEGEPERGGGYQPRPGSERTGQQGDAADRRGLQSGLGVDRRSVAADSEGRVQQRRAGSRQLHFRFPRADRPEDQRRDQAVRSSARCAADAHPCALRSHGPGLHDSRSRCHVRQGGPAIRRCGDPGARAGGGYRRGGCRGRVDHHSDGLHHGPREVR